MSTVTMYDPPSGWKYGFPKVYSPIEGEGLEHTLSRDGYPSDEADFAAKHCRFWLEPTPKSRAVSAALCAYDDAARRDVEGRGWPFGREGSNGDHIATNDNLRHVADATGRNGWGTVAQPYTDDHPRVPGQRRGDWMQLYSGKQFWPMDPRANEIEIEDIAHSLSMQCRYAGHCIRFYSVAEHSVLLARFFLDCDQPETAMWALLHDASEAYLVDVPRPVKPFLPGYKEAEARVMSAVCERFGLPQEMPWQVHEADSAIIGNERENMKPCVAEWYATGGPLLGVELFYWAPEKAEAAFLSCFREIERVRQQQRRVAA